MWALDVVMMDPAGEDRAGLTDREKQRLVEQLVAHTVVEPKAGVAQPLDEPFLRRFARRNVTCWLFHAAASQHRTLSLTIILGHPRSAIR